MACVTLSPIEYDAVEFVDVTCLAPSAFTANCASAIDPVLVTLDVKAQNPWSTLVPFRKLTELSMDDVTAGVFHLVRLTFGCFSNDVTRETRAEDVDGWDSLSHSVLLVGIERQFGIQLDYDEVYDVADVGGLIDCVSRELQARTGGKV